MVLVGRQQGEIPLASEGVTGALNPTTYLVALSEISSKTNRRTAPFGLHIPLNQSLSVGLWVRCECSMRGCMNVSYPQLPRVCLGMVTPGKAAPPAKAPGKAAPEAPRQECRILASPRIRCKPATRVEHLRSHCNEMYCWISPLPVFRFRWP